MRVLVLQQPNSVAPFESWLMEAAPGVEVRIITGAATVRPDSAIAPGVRRDVLADYHAPETTRHLFQVCAEWAPQAVFSNSEADVMRAAEARTLFGIPGTGSASAVLFRDKVLMKQLFAGLTVQGTEVAAVEHRVPTSGADVLAACDELGPVVLKPRDGSGSVSVQTLSDRAQAAAWLAAEPEVLKRLHASQLILERFVEGDVYHVDMLARDGAPIMISTSRYLHPPHHFARHNLASVMLDEDSEDHRFLVAYGQALTARAATAHGATIMHLEMFRTPQGEFVAGEVACRGSGGLVKESILHTYGIDQARAACLLGAGLLPGETYLRRIRQQSGRLLETGPRLGYDRAARPSWLVTVSESERPGEASSSVDARLQVVVEGENESEIEKRMASLHLSA
ncbi:ATP-grasp domain-containing protein [Kineosporia sp. J2-2]|uniref:ATP-grasp domain-containing protein n=1 Tax=Kineosporia corallincola TaxID=2835133 RepID=A0ABS5TQF2_9ACTN|nr:ATP-grasp domain-containing protein [Kineosporia corallincola]MBT0773340.1 ATP-grasp domain-containing protein [Kineosporia corallincola]